MKRREFIVGLAGAAAGWPSAVRAQQPMPVIGLLNSATIAAQAERLADFQLGLKETGFVAGQNVTIEFRSAEGLADQLPVLARDLVRRQVSVMVATSTASALAANRATKTLPIVFLTGGPPPHLFNTSSASSNLVHRIYAHARPMPGPDVLRSSAEVVAYAGLNPRQHQSGTSIDRATRISKIGNAVLRAALYMPALSAMRYNSAIVALVSRLKSRGRLKPKQIVVAAMRKLLVLCFGVLKTGRPFDAAIAMGG